MSSAIERPFIETRSHNDRPMNGFLSDRDEFSSGIAPKCLIGHRSADHRYRSIREKACAPVLAPPRPTTGAFSKTLIQNWATLHYP
ncbi:hypothetical protein AVEN_33919-1 [Araneus ventricosus]|uniref:Uncharacterized protein n=1 Tax=Araneus ventricosus TaxID=182803 RepID=A0A4Y2KNJ0_ARAVE|nr:hypothetical protein AVEN_33919-1 [Araneus ventricosus]